MITHKLVNHHIDPYKRPPRVMLQSQNESGRYPIAPGLQKTREHAYIVQYVASELIRLVCSTWNVEIVGPFIQNVQSSGDVWCIGILHVHFAVRIRTQGDSGVKDIAHCATPADVLMFRVPVVAGRYASPTRLQ